jgi:hypothetical protein
MMGEDMPAFTSTRTFPSGDMMKQPNNIRLARSVGQFLEQLSRQRNTVFNVNGRVLFRRALVPYGSPHEKPTGHQSSVTTARVKP